MDAYHGSSFPCPPTWNDDGREPWPAYYDEARRDGWSDEYWPSQEAPVYDQSSAINQGWVNRYQSMGYRPYHRAEPLYGGLNHYSPTYASILYPNPAHISSQRTTGDWHTKTLGRGTVGREPARVRPLLDLDFPAETAAAWRGMVASWRVRPPRTPYTTRPYGSTGSWDRTGKTLTHLLFRLVQNKHHLKNWHRMPHSLRNNVDNFLENIHIPNTDTALTDQLRQSADDFLSSLQRHVRAHLQDNINKIEIDLTRFHNLTGPEVDHSIAVATGELKHRLGNKLSPDLLQIQMRWAKTHLITGSNIAVAHPRTPPTSMGSNYPPTLPPPHQPQVASSP